jgi:ribosomal protein S21
MRMPARLRLGMIVSLIVALTTAGIGLASVGSDALPDEITSCQPTGDTSQGDVAAEQDDQGEDEAAEAQEADESEGSGEANEAEDSEESDDPDEADQSIECEDAADQEGSEGTDGSDSTSDGAVDAATTEQPTPEGVAACTEAAGLTSAEAPSEKPQAGELHGLENAIAHVLWNCLRNDNEGLPNALEHLKANVERKLLHDELKAQRAAEREAAKEARRAAHAAAKAAHIHSS